MKSRNLIIASFAVIIGLATQGCVRPVQKPIVKEVENHQTAFLINLEGSKEGQVKFDSIEYLNEVKIAAKRIEIPTRWLKTGRWNYQGQWIPTQKLITVDRTPVARRWTEEENTGTSKEIQMLQAESRDSIGVNSGMAITAYIKEEDTALFLYRYPGSDLPTIIDNQIFNDCQAVYAEVAAKYNVTELRTKKDEINREMVETVIPVYAADGITIKPTMGLIGGLVYDNPAIQTAIDAVFIAQNLEAKAEAERVAQLKLNERDLSIETTDAERRQIKADAEAYEIIAKAKAVSEQGSTYLELLRLEVYKEAVLKWHGQLPTTLAGGGNMMNHLLLNNGPNVVPSSQIAQTTTKGN